MLGPRLGIRIPLKNDMNKQCSSSEENGGENNRQTQVKTRKWESHETGDRSNDKNV